MVHLVIVQSQSSRKNISLPIRQFFHLRHSVNFINTPIYQYSYLLSKLIGHSRKKMEMFIQACDTLFFLTSNVSNQATSDY